MSVRNYSSKSDVRKRMYILNLHREGDVLEENSRSLFSFLKFISLLGLTVHHLRSIWKNKDDLEISSTSSATQKMFVSQYLYTLQVCNIFSYCYK